NEHSREEESSESELVEESEVEEIPRKKAKVSSSKIELQDRKVLEVDLFAGEAHKIGKFLDDLSTYFFMRPQSYDSDKVKILYASTRLTGKTAEWWRGVKEKIDGSGPTSAKWQSYVEFVEELKLNFED